MSGSKPMVSPVSTGGKGVAFENGFGAFVLTHLLTEKPLAFLGSPPTRVQFQASALSPVDDFVVEGGVGNVMAYVAARMKPSITSSHDATVELFKAFAEEYVKDPAAMKDGSKVLVLACLPYRVHTDTLRDLCQIAWCHADASSFDAAIQRRNKQLRDRWKAFQELTLAAGAGIAHSPGAWEFLKALKVETHSFEAGAKSVVDARDLLNGYRTSHPAAPNITFDQLVGISHSTASAGGSITRESLLEWLANQQLTGARPSAPDAINTARAVVPQKVSGLAGWARFHGYDLTEQEHRDYLAEDEQQLAELRKVLAEIYPAALDTLVVYLQQATWHNYDRSELQVSELDQWRKGCGYMDIASHLDTLGRFHLIFLDEESGVVASNQRFALCLRFLAEFCEATGVDLRSVITDKQWALLD